MLLALFAFVCGSLLVAAAAKALSPRSATIVDRLEEIVGVHTRAPEESRFTKTLVDTFMISSPRSIVFLRRSSR